MPDTPDELRNLGDDELDALTDAVAGVASEVVLSVDLQVAIERYQDVSLSPDQRKLVARDILGRTYGLDEAARKEVKERLGEEWGDVLRDAIATIDADAKKSSPATGVGEATEGADEAAGAEPGERPATTAARMARLRDPSLAETERLAAFAQISGLSELLEVVDQSGISAIL